MARRGMIYRSVTKSLALPNLVTFQITKSRRDSVAAQWQHSGSTVAAQWQHRIAPNRQVERSSNDHPHSPTIQPGIIFQMDRGAV